MINIGIVGVNGLVGQAILDSIKRLNLINTELINTKYVYHFFGSTNSETYFNNQKYKIKKFELEDLYQLNYAILAIDNTLARDIYFFAKENMINTIIIDNSSEFRMYPNVPLCIPEINSNTINHNKFIANPNCVTTIACMVFKPLLELANIKRIVASTYQAASGAGYKGLQELVDQTKQIIYKDNLSTDFWKKQYIYNVFSHNTNINKETLYNEEEMKFIKETKKILNINPKITCTCVRVPTLRSHCISLNIEFDKEIDKNEILRVLNNFDGIKIVDDIDDNQFPEPVKTSEKVDIQVGRIRPDIDDKTCWNFFVSGDQLLKGAGYNSVQILKYLLDKNE